MLHGIVAAELNFSVGTSQIAADKVLSFALAERANVGENNSSGQETIYHEADVFREMGFFLTASRSIRVELLQFDHCFV
jgi:hypothetical protein